MQTEPNQTEPTSNRTEPNRPQNDPQLAFGQPVLIGGRVWTIVAVGSEQSMVERVGVHMREAKLVENQELFRARVRYLMQMDAAKPSVASEMPAAANVTMLRQRIA